MRSRLIIVLGMHRSGTSALTRGLQVMGVGLGERLIPSREGDNPKGFWEDTDIYTLNNLMLSALDSDWHHLAPINPVAITALCHKDYFSRAVELLQQRVGHGPFGFKDPRLTILLPFWQAVISHCQLDMSYVLALRHPLSVTKSLAARNGFVAEKSYLLWLKYVITGLAGTAGDKRVLVDFDRLIQSPDRELKRIAKRLNLEIDPPELQIYKTEFLDESLRHTVYDLHDLALDNACPPLAREVYAALSGAAADAINLDDIALQNKITHWAGEFERLKAPLALFDRLFIQQGVAMQSLIEKEHVINELHQSAQEHLEIIERQQTELIAKEAVIQRLAATHPGVWLSRLLPRRLRQFLKQRWSQQEVYQK